MTEAGELLLSYAFAGSVAHGFQGVDSMLGESDYSQFSGQDESRKGYGKLEPVVLTVAVNTPPPRSSYLGLYTESCESFRRAQLEVVLAGHP